ncbi:outer membrane lipoprotein-sorting protein-like protein [Thermoanaerobacter kivui]|uniref:Outer membrane lipoprotein-sorting protein-like protein n=1 Tax=Thermoanaerobacter kivui TaxID=2325 RepID=A0A097ATB0_THEKI|nr:outer membrane lipoprotein carrier protein LolA [Thermoanaerobacter kivui]AIS53042.1 outer membrane lipoprotein-sorting protein-like protein [Thermoanaerobacter kivui]
MKFRFVGVLLIFILLLSGCSQKVKKGKDPFSSIKEQLNNLESYIATASIELYNNKIYSKFTVMQFYKKGKYRLEVLDENKNPDKIIVYNGNRSYVYFSKVNQIFVAENTQEVPLYSLVTSFIKNYINAGGEIDKKETNDFYVIAVPILERNIFMYKEEMGFSKKDLKPQVLTIYDINSEVFAKVTYRDFEYNPEIDDKLFTKDSITTLAINILQSHEMSIDAKEVYEYCGINPLIPVYMPSGYKLLNILVDQRENNGVTLIYTSGENMIKIVETVNSNFTQEGEKQTLSDGVYYVKGDKGEKAYVALVNGIQIKIIINDAFSEKEVLKIIKSLR